MPVYRLIFLCIYKCFETKKAILSMDIIARLTKIAEERLEIR